MTPTTRQYVKYMSIMHHATSAHEKHPWNHDTL